MQLNTQPQALGKQRAKPGQGAGVTVAEPDGQQAIERRYEILVQ